MNLYEFVMMFFYVSLCTGILSIGCHFTEKMKEQETKARKLEIVMTNLENPLDK